MTSSPETTGPIEDLSCLKFAFTGKVLKVISNTTTWHIRKYLQADRTYQPRKLNLQQNYNCKNL